MSQQSGPNDNSSSLKAGSTKNKNNSNNLASKQTNIGSNISKKGGFGRLKGPVSGTKTSHSEAEGIVVIVNGKVKTPKELITKKYKEYTDEYLKLLETQQENEKKAKEQTEVQVKSSLNSHMQSEMKVSSSVNQEKSFMSSSKSEVDSQADSKKEKQTIKKKDPKQLRIQDLQKQVTILLTETETQFTFFLPSTSYRQDDQAIKITNVKYREYVQKRIGSDKYIGRPVQTFNFQHKKLAETVEKPPSNDTGCFAATWDIADVMKLEKKTQFQILQEEIRKNVDKEYSNFLVSPFACLSLEKAAIDIHSKYEVPGAADYMAKQNQLDRKTRSKKIGGGGAGAGQTGQTGMAQVSSTNNRSEITKQDTSQKKREQSSQNSNRKGLRSAQLQVEIRQEQERIEQEEKEFLDGLMHRAKSMPSEEERKMMVDENLQRMLKYIDRILNSQTYHKEYVLYRNYPEIEFVKKTPESEMAHNFSKKKKDEAKKEENKEPLQYLFSFSTKEYSGYSVTSADWNPINQDLLAVTYELSEKDPNLTALNPKKGLLMFWTLKNPAFPEKIFHFESRFTACKFSTENPNLIACGTHDGVITIYDIRKKDNNPIAENKESLDKHTNSVWDVQWIGKGKNNKGESLVSISADGRITEWSMKKGLEYTDLMLLRRIPQSTKKDQIENMNFRFASGLSFQFLKSEASMYLATTEEGIIYRCSKSYTQQYLQVYMGHSGPVYKVRCNPFFHDLFLTCSADWSCKLWNWRKDSPLNTFQSLDLTDEVIDIEWSPSEACLFASVCKDGRLELWDLTKKNMLDPICIVRPKQGKTVPKTIVRFCRGAPVLVTGDMHGDIKVYRLNSNFHFGLKWWNN